MSLVKRHPIITFFMLAYAIAWGFVPFGSFGAFAPLVAALIVISITQGWAGLKVLGLRMIRWRVRWYWYAVAIGLPLAVHLAIVGLNVAAGWHLPTFFLEEGALQPSVLVSGLVVTMAVTFWYAWLFNHTGGSILLLVIAHDIEGSIQYELGWIVMGVWLAVAIGLVVFDWKAWRGPAPAPATTVLQPPYEGESRVR